MKQYIKYMCLCISLIASTAFGVDIGDVQSAVEAYGSPSPSTSFYLQVKCPTTTECGQPLDVKITPIMTCVPDNSSIGLFVDRIIIQLMGNPNGATSTGTPNNNETIWGPFARSITFQDNKFPHCGPYAPGAPPKIYPDKFTQPYPTITVRAIDTVPTSLKGTSAVVRLNVIDTNGIVAPSRSHLFVNDCIVPVQ